MSRPMVLLAISLLAMAGFVLAASADGPVFPDDWDGDGILDEFDNCIEDPNGTLLGPIDVDHPQYIIQDDGDEDGFGNVPGPSGLACSASNIKGSCPPVISW